MDWELIDGKKLKTIKTSGTALVTDVTEALNLALAGVGIASVHEPLVRRYIPESFGAKASFDLVGVVLVSGAAFGTASAKSLLSA